MAIQDIKNQKSFFDGVGLLSSIVGIGFAVCCAMIPLSKEFKLLDLGLGFLDLGLGFVALMAINISSSKKKEILALSREAEEINKFE